MGVKVGIWTRTIGFSWFCAVLVGLGIDSISVTPSVIKTVNAIYEAEQFIKQKK
jgi:phosphoenolpyruvate-protein kinase (PTS system EI component)